ncbi:MAG: DUF1122 family protein [Chloroflexota bacterium]
MTMSDRGVWVRAASDPLAGPASWDGLQVGDDVRLEVWLGPRNGVGAQYFRCFLTSDHGRPDDFIVFGLQHSGPYPGMCWVDVIEYHETLTMPDGRALGVPAGIERAIFQALGTSVPAGGHVMAEYDSPGRRVTARALELRVPPAATPLGTVLRMAGLGDYFRDWYFAEGGREGARKLQGFRALNEQHARERGLEMLVELRAFMAGAAELDWGIQAQTRPLAEAAIADLSARFEG